MMDDLKFPCRLIPTRSCPKSYNSVCGERPCARLESEDETPWIPEVRETYGDYR